MNRPLTTAGLRHVALFIQNFDACIDFYTRLLGMTIDWQPDADNVYLTTRGQDNLALHRAPAHFQPDGHQHLDHLGFFLTERTDVDDWHQFLIDNQVEIKARPRDHRDGTRSFYCADPDGNIIQLIYIPK